MKPLSLLVATTLLCSTAFAGDIRIVGVGHVFSIAPTPLTGALAGVDVGDSFEMTLEVFDTPTILGFGARTYPFDAAAGQIEVGGLTLHYDTPTEDFSILNSSFAGDQLAAPIEIDAPGDLTAALLLADPSGLALPTEDLAQLVGTTYLQAAPGNLIAGIDSANGNTTVVVQITEIRIENGGGGGGPTSGSYCSANPTSTGAPASVTASGSFVAADNDLTLTATGLPTNAFGFFITSQSQGFVSGPAGSQGNLCLGGGIGRYVGPGQIKNSGAIGSFFLDLDLTQTPTPTGLVAVTAGETWNYQTWFRDSVGGAPTSNFTDGYSVVFQ